MGTALLGLAATGGFGVLAAVTYAGQAATTNATTTVNSDLNPGPQYAGSYGGSGTTSNSGPTSGSGSGNYAPLHQPQVPATTSTRHAHASSGGSGG